jgi:AcrR family transcriptional regulator
MVTLDSSTKLAAAIADAPRPAPRSARGRRTRAALVAAARTVFERDGFLESRIVDIAAEAGVAVGSFYTHFRDREDAFAAVLAEVEADMLQPTFPATPRGDVRDVVDAANRTYFEAYRRNARMNALMEQVAAIDEGFMAIRRRRADRFVGRNARAIRRLQHDGVADPGLDPQIAAAALSGMVSRMAYRAYVERRDVPFDTLVTTATRLWLNALRID